MEASHASPTLVEFLDSKKLLSTFMRRCVDNGSAFNVERLSDNELEINSAFVWHHTPEGEVFWQKLDREYRLLCSN